MTRLLQRGGIVWAWGLFTAQNATIKTFARRIPGTRKSEFSTGNGMRGPTRHSPLHMKPMCPWTGTSRTILARTPVRLVGGKEPSAISSW